MSFLRRAAEYRPIRQAAEAEFMRLADAAEVQVNPIHPQQHDVVVHDRDAFLRNLVCYGSGGMGFSYASGTIDMERVDLTVERLLRARQVMPRGIMETIISQTQNVRVRLRAQWQDAKEVAQGHYDLGDDYFGPMLGASQLYTCPTVMVRDNTGEFDLTQSQLASVRHRVDQLKLNSDGGQTVLDIGCGKGQVLREVAERGHKAIGLTVSEGQTQTARNICDHVKDHVEIIIKDYREAANDIPAGSVDGVISTEMIEAVPTDQLEHYFEFVQHVLKPGGIFVLQAINSMRKVWTTDAFLDARIFHNGVLPYRLSIERYAEAQQLMTQKVQEIGDLYVPTLRAWCKNFITAWPQMRARYQDYHNGEFYRTQQYYLLSCAGAAASEYYQDTEFVMQKTT